MRVGGVLLAAMAALAMGCGSSDGSDGEGNSTVATVSTYETASGLSQPQYEALEELLVAILPLDKIDVTKDLEKAQRVLDEAAAACSDVDRGDPLLAAMVDGCERTLATLAALDPDCSSASQCGQAMGSLAEAVDDLARTARANQPTIARAVSRPACREALLSSEVLEVAEFSVPVYRQAADAIGNADQEAYAALEDDMAAIDTRSEALPSQRQELERFRRNCRP